MKSQAKGAELALTARMPKIQVRPRSGRRASAPMKTDLGIKGGKKFQSTNEFITIAMNIIIIFLCVDVDHIHLAYNHR